MPETRSKGFTSFWVVAVLLAGSAAFGQVDDVFLSGGRTSIDFYEHLLEDLGIQVTEVRGATAAHEGVLEFEILEGEASKLVIDFPQGAFRGALAGALRHAGGFTLRSADLRISLDGFEIRPGDEPLSFALWSTDGTPVFFLDHPHAQLVPGGQFTLRHMDLRFSESLARRIARPDLVGVAIGRVDVVASLEGADPLAAGSGICKPDFTGEVDVELSAMSSLSEVFHDDDRVAIAPSATVFNVGTADVLWYRSIFPDGTPLGQHPMLVMNFYRIADGVIRQLGRSDVKHAFFATNSPPCNCQGDQVLFDNCTDLYGTSTNANRKFLASRSEVNANTVNWTSLGSHFDGDPVDDERDHSESDHPDKFEHRLVVKSADLLVAGAEYYSEAWYLAKGDVDLFNSIGYRKTTPSFSGGWSFPLTTPLVLGSTVDTWVDPLAPGADAANVAVDTGEGQLKVAARASQLPDGFYRYEFALVNLNFDRQISSFTVLNTIGATIRNSGFNDVDSDAANDWPATAGATDVTWTAPTGNALDWGTMYNFRFEADITPVDNLVTLGFLEPGSTSQIAAASKGPEGTISTGNISVSTTGGGSVQSSPVGIDCGGTCSASFGLGAEVALTASTTSGWAFDRWEESATTVSHDLTYELMTTGSHSLDAVFEACQDVVSLTDQTVASTEVFSACNDLTAGAEFVVGAPNGKAIFRAGSSIVLDDGFTVESGAEFRAEIVPEQATP